jgi:hypothetical protein
MLFQREYIFIPEKLDVSIVVASSLKYVCSISISILNKLSHVSNPMLLNHPTVTVASLDEDSGVSITGLHGSSNHVGSALITHEGIVEPTVHRGTKPIGRGDFVVWK